MSPKRLNIFVFAENEKLTLFPIIPGKNAIQIWFVLPVYVVNKENAKNIGEKVLEVAEYIDTIVCGDAEIRKVEPDNIPKELGYSSWKKLNAEADSVSIMRNQDIEPDKLSMTPLVPGKGAQYTRDESRMMYASLESPSDIGQALLDVLSNMKVDLTK